MKQEGFEVEVEKDPISDPINKTTKEVQECPLVNQFLLGLDDGTHFVN